MSIYELVNKLFIDENYIQWRQYHNKENIWNILNRTTDEISHSKFLAFLLDSSRNGTIDIYALQQLLRLLVICNIKSGSKNKVLSEYQNIILNGSNIVSIDTIVCEKADRKARYDIFIKLLLDGSPVTLIIENKVTSSENIGQTKKYSNYAKDYKNPILVYLSIKEERVNEDFITINYQQLLDNVIQPSLRVCHDDRTKILIEDYIRTLSRIDGAKGVKIMAISKEERQLLKDIYDNNQELIMQMFEAISGELDEKEKAALQVLNEHTASRNTKWSYGGEIMTSKALVRAIVQNQLQMGQSFEAMAKYKMHSAPMIVASIEPNEDRYEPLKISDGRIVYVRNCCDRKDVERLINELNIDASIVIN